MDEVITIKDGTVECARLRTSEGARFALHYHRGGNKSYVTQHVDGAWREVPPDQLYNLVEVGFDDGVLVNKIAALIEGRAV